MKPGRILILLSIAFVSIVIFVNKCNRKDSLSGKTGKGGGMNSIAVKGFIVEPTVLSEAIQLAGSLSANKEVEIKNEISGRIIKIYFDEGASVTKGDLLVKIYDEDLLAQLKLLEVEERLLKLKESRQSDLLTIQGISQQEYDEALSALQLVQAKIELLKLQIAKTEIRAPFSGKIGLELVSEGAILAMNTSIVTLQEIDPLRLEFFVPERYKNMIRENQKVQFEVQSAAKLSEAIIYAIEPKIDPSTRSVLVRARLRNSEFKFSPGAFASVKVPLIDVEAALMIPSQAIIPELKGYKLFIQKNGKASPRKIDIGVRNDSTVQVISGLNPGDTVITNGIMQLRPEMPVKVKLD